MSSFKKYVFRKYSARFTVLFEQERAKLKKILPNASIEHVGSTAIPGLGGKGIIDITIETPKEKLEQFIRKLKKAGYEERPQHRPDKNRVFLQKIIKSKGKERRIHIHLVFNKRYLDTFIAFRDYLRDHKEERDEYAELKKKAVKLGLEGEDYRKYKNKFLESLTKKALKERK